jgi:hypothetical protein
VLYDINRPSAGVSQITAARNFESFIPLGLEYNVRNLRVTAVISLNLYGQRSLLGFWLGRDATQEATRRPTIITLAIGPIKFSNTEQQLSSVRSSTRYGFSCQ